MNVTRVARIVCAPSKSNGGLEHKPSTDYRRRQSQSQVRTFRSSARFRNDYSDRMQLLPFARTALMMNVRLRCRRWQFSCMLCTPTMFSMIWMVFVVSMDVEASSLSTATASSTKPARRQWRQRPHRHRSRRWTGRVLLYFYVVVTSNIS